MLAQGQSSSAKRGGLAAVSSGLIFLQKKKKKKKTTLKAVSLFFQDAESQTKSNDCGLITTYKMSTVATQMKQLEMHIWK